MPGCDYTTNTTSHHPESATKPATQQKPSVELGHTIERFEELHSRHLSTLCERSGPPLCRCHRNQLSPQRPPRSIHRVCDHCGDIDYLTAGEYLLQNTPLVSFCLSHGVDVTSGPIWDFEFAATGKHASVEQTDPWEIKFTLPLSEDTLRIRLNETLSATIATS